MISLVSGVASAYFELLELDEQLAIAKRTRDSYQRTFRLFDDQHAAGHGENASGTWLAKTHPGDPAAAA